MKMYSRALILLPCLLLCLTACHPGADRTDIKVSPDPAPVPKTSFVARYNEGPNTSMLLLACIVYAKEAAKPLNIDSVQGFYDIYHTLIAYSNELLPGTLEDHIDSFVSVNKTIDFNSQKAQERLHDFIENYNLISVIYANAGSDDKPQEIKEVEKKIDRVPAISAIYRKYVALGRDPTGLSSGEGATLNIHLAYYLSLQKTADRNAILKALL